MRNRRLIILFSIITFIVFLVILNSIAFRVKEIEAHCYNDKSKDFKAAVESASDLKGKNIFVLSERKSIDKIHSACPDARVVNIERKFPNRTVINVVRKFEHAYLEHNGEYIIVDNDMRVLEKGPSPLPQDKRLIRIDIDAPNPGFPLAVPAVLTKYETGGYIQTDKGTPEEILKKLFEGFSRLDYDGNNMIWLINSIGVSSSREEIWIQTNSGVKIKIEHTGRLLEKTRAAVSVYLDNTGYRNSGTIIIGEDSKGKITGSYDKN